MSDKLKNQFRGCMVGMAVGDALGAAAEFMREHEVRSAYGVLKDYRPAPYFELGEFTDDTSMALAIAESVIEAEGVDVEHITDKFVEWMRTDGRGIGILTHNALVLVEDGLAPIQAGLRAWDQSGKTSAGNGAVMRCAPLGLLNYGDVDALVRETILVSQVTHYDPRCCWSSVAVNSAIAAMLNGVNPFETAVGCVEGKCSELDNALQESQEKSVGAMKLDGADQGYTILTTQAAFAALREFDNFEAGIIAVINKGGDADTNACVAGALLGARDGINGIPKRWVDGLVGLERVISAADGLYELAVQ